MCVALPMEVLSVNAFQACCRQADGGERLVDVSMLEPVKAGDWVLVFRDEAIRAVSAEEAREVENALRATALVMEGDESEANIRAGFGDLIDREPPLPEHLRALVGRKA